MMTVRTLPVLAIAFLAATPAAAQAERPPDPEALRAVGLRVTWPVSDAVPAFYAGERLVVRVAAAARAPQASVSLVRVDARGGTVRVVAQRSMGDGTVRFGVPASGGRYRLRLDVAGQRYFSSFTARRPRPPTRSCPAGRRAAADVALSQGSGVPGEVLRVRVRNTGRACLTGGRRHHWERRLPDGTWEVVAAGGDAPGPLDVVTVPGRSTTSTTIVPPNLRPGPHRVVTKVASDDGPLVLAVPFEVEEPPTAPPRSAS
jgi:hypothetical protein